MEISGDGGGSSEDSEDDGDRCASSAQQGHRQLERSKTWDGQLQHDATLVDSLPFVSGGVWGGLVRMAVP